MMRCRQEREEIARMMGGSEGSDDSLGEDIKPEGISHGESPFDEYASSNMENSPDADIERKGQDMKLGHIRNFYAQQNANDITVSGKREGSQDMQLNHRFVDENAAPHTGGGGSTLNQTLKGGSVAIDQQKVPLDKNQRAKMLENLRYLENPMLLELYGTLLADNSRSFWDGPHSLIRDKGGPALRNSLQSAISSFMA